MGSTCNCSAVQAVVALVREQSFAAELSQTAILVSSNWRCPVGQAGAAMAPKLSAVQIDHTWCFRLIDVVILVGVILVLDHNLSALDTAVVEAAKVH